ncbi:hypothetical protein [Eikenella sp. NML070372]|uniref:hypothetical protein n=1 Tax=Eikenella sp. NML070372 TaxID=1795829 RepID=UPI003515ED0B
MRTLAQRLTRGALLFIDYGFDAAQYYHPPSAAAAPSSATTAITLCTTPSNTSASPTLPAM